MLRRVKQTTKLLFLRPYLNKLIHKQSATNNEIFQIQSILRPAHIPPPCHLKSLVLEVVTQLTKYIIRKLIIFFLTHVLIHCFFLGVLNCASFLVSRFLKVFSRTIYWMIYLNNYFVFISLFQFNFL